MEVLMEVLMVVLMEVIMEVLMEVLITRAIPLPHESKNREPFLLRQTEVSAKHHAAYSDLRWPFRLRKWVICIGNMYM